MSATAAQRGAADVADAIVERLHAFPPPPPELADAVREAGGPPSPEGDPLNALVRRCSVRARVTIGDGLLAGRTLVVKDVIAVAGVPLTGGSRALEGYVPAHDSTVVRRALDAGAEIVGIANMDELGASSSGCTSVHGPTRNPFDRTRSAGGSSGGSAAALSYPWVDLALGCDQGGSLRLPASWCGVVGLKPTHGLVPYTGIVGMQASLDHVGPLGRTVRDVATLLQAIAGPDGRDPRQRDARPPDLLSALDDARASALRGWRVGVVAEDPSAGVETDPAVAAATADAVARLAASGASVERVELGIAARARAVHSIAMLSGLPSLLDGGVSYQLGDGQPVELGEALAHGLRERWGELGPDLQRVLKLGRALRRRHRGAPYAWAELVRAEIRREVDRALAPFDVLVMPTSPLLPPEVPEGDLTEARRRTALAIVNTLQFNVTGHPAMTLPLAAADGLPVGISAVARQHDEPRLLAFAAACERELGWAGQ